MSNYLIDVINENVHILEIETSIGEVVNNIEIERLNDYSITIINTEKILASDLPDNIPMNKIIGDLAVGRISGLAAYLNSYQFDCGSP